MIFIDHTKLFMQHLIGNFPREVGIPKRRVISSYEAFIDFAQRSHLEYPVFTSLYNMYPHENKVEISSLWTDLDAFNQFQLLYEVKTIHKRLLNLGIETEQMVVGSTGKKGFHNYAKLLPKKYDIEESKEALHYILSYVCRDLTTPDTPLFGDVNRIVRVAGIQRPEGSFMVMINPEELFLYESVYEYFEDYNFEWNKIIDSGTQYLKKMKSGANIDIIELYKQIKDKTGFIPPKPQVIPLKSKIFATNREREVYKYSEFLQKILKNDQLFYAVHAPNPVHVDRIRFALKLMRVELDFKTISDIIESLNWIDFDLNTTMFYLADLKERYL